MKSSPADRDSIQRITDYILDLNYFGNDGKTPLHTRYEKGDSRLLLVTGENATGKSFFCKLYEAYCRHYLKQECIRVGMGLRTAGGMACAFVYKEEDNFSTGDISTGAVIGGVETCKNRDNAHHIIFDEPTFGLSDSYQIAMGNYFADFARAMPKNTKGLVIVSHSRYMMQPLAKVSPHHLRMGDDLSLDEWLKMTPKERTVDELVRLEEVGVLKLREIEAVRDKGKNRNQ